MTLTAIAAVLALSVRPPWSHWIVAGIEPIENRSWQVNWRGTLAIHASTTVDELGFAHGAAIGHHLEPDDVARGEFIGAVDLIGIHPASSDRCDDRCRRWGNPTGWHWELSNARRITSIEARGRLRLYTPPADVLEQLVAA